MDIIDKIIDEEIEKYLKEERCWDGHERNYKVPKGEQGSCKVKKEAANPTSAHNIVRRMMKTGDDALTALMSLLSDPQISREEASNWLKRNAQDVQKAQRELGYRPGGGLGSPTDMGRPMGQTPMEEAEICDAGISYVTRTDPGGKDIKRGKDKDKDGKGDLQNWSARAAQIASKYCKDPDYGKGRGKDAKDESIEEGEGGLKAWEKEKWTHSDGTPCGGGKEDGSNSRCKPASKWKTMSKGEKAADNKKKKAGTKSGKQYVKSNHPVTKSHTKRNEGKSIHTAVRLRIAEADELDEKKKKKKKKKKKPCKKAKGKKFVKRVNGRCRSYGQSGKAKDGGARIRPGTKKGDAYCARSAKIKKCKNPPCANALSRKKWKCRGSKSMKENEQE
jgi:hypothetical protein